NLVIKTTLPYEEWPAGWVEGWFGDATVEVVEKEEDEEDENDEDDKKDDDSDQDKNEDNKERGRG
ncbi:MAG: hypothetical protein J6V22_00360, partial [Clostridia bacterium]|nr:hypothetical protein [Clostridia bacterium]